MATTESEVYRAIDDPLYSLTAEKVPVDKDTIRRESSYISATLGGTGACTAAGCLNTGKQTIFDITQPSGARLRWGTCCLRMQFCIATTAGTATVPNTGSTNYYALNSVPWDLPAAFFKNLRLDIDSNGQLYSCSDSNFRPEFQARLIKDFSYNQLDNMSDVLMTPVFAQRYTRELNDTVTAEFLDPFVLSRANQYCLTQNGKDTSGARAESATHARVITKYIPFTLLFPRLPDAIYHNLRKVKITIDWVNSQDLLDAAATGSKGGAFLTQVDVVTDHYIMSAGQTTAALQEKLSGTPDILPFYNCTIYKEDYTPGSAIRIPGIRNFAAVMVWQPARARDNGKSTTNKASFASGGEFIFGQNTVAANTLIKARADDPDGYPSTTVHGIESVQIFLDQTPYPNTPITTYRTVNSVACQDFAELYYHYQLAVNRVGRRDIGPAVPYDVFRSTMPFIFLAPLPSDAPKPSAEGKDLRIVMTGGYATSSSGQQMTIAVFTFNVHKLVPSDQMGKTY